MSFIRMAILGLLVYAAFSYAYADVLIGVTAKYGPNGYDVEGTQSSTTTNTTYKKPHKTTSSSSTKTVNGLDIDNRMQVVPGLTIQSIPDPGGLSFGAGAYTDSTLSVFLGLRL